MIKRILLIFILASNTFAQLTPNPKPSDVLEPTQDGVHFTLWENILGVYAQFRQTAKNILSDINSVVELAASAQRQLAAIENVAVRIESISKYIENYNFTDPIQFVKDMEEGVFTQSDMLIYRDIPNVGVAYQDMVDARDDVIKRGKTDLKAVVSASQTVYNATVSTYDRVFGGKVEYTEINLQGSSINNTKSSVSIASHTANQVSLDNQGTSISSQIQRITNSSGDLTPDQMANSNIEANRNSLILNYESNEFQSDKITNLSLLLLEQTRRMYNREKTKEKVLYSFRKD